ncbi:HAMP domain-containing sensor histidine kinase [Rubrobacter aplysinae]|uniref:HAMP domain-containing sensor histidine kinase n=1 Tax=Rubrobacter aplysinae TaxID=909625 RepID=UPI00064C1F5C|nr:ATP-binding protein [Rubrobacter aplysinae]
MKSPIARLSAYVSSYNLGPKLLLSHLLVTLIGMITFGVVSFVAPLIFGGNGAADLLHTLLYLLLATAASMVSAMAASLFVAGRITRPLKYMLAATRRISGGSYGEQVPVQESDELGELSESFNAMAAALRDGELRRQEFIADVSHELRTPLSTLQGYMEGLLDGVVEPDEETWGLLYAESERMRRLVEDLRQLSRVEAGQLDLHPASSSAELMVCRATESLAPLFAEGGVRLETSLPEGLPEVFADSDRVVQVLTNLLRNALHYTPADGKVTVAASPRNAEVLFTISDTGSGIPPEHLDRVFERFYRVEKSRSREGGGSGVGLAISRALVQSMHGEIWAESRGAREGTTFAFTLPISRGTASEGSRKS